MYALQAAEALNSWAIFSAPVLQFLTYSSKEEERVGQQQGACLVFWKARVYSPASKQNFAGDTQQREDPYTVAESVNCTISIFENYTDLLCAGK